MQGTGAGGDISGEAGGGIFLHAPATARPGTRRTGDVSAETKPSRAAIARRTRQEDRVQPFLSEPDFFRANRADHHAIPATVAHGEGGGVAQVPRVQRDGSRSGSGLQQPQPFQRGVSRDFRLLSGVVSAGDRDAKISHTKSLLIRVLTKLREAG